MNIQNYTPFELTWREIFEKQKELKFMYEPEAKELFENFDIDCFEDQELFKKYCWRITEELTEMEEAHFKEKDSKDHIQEELIDALNFSIELMLLYGWTEKNYETVPSSHFGNGILNRTGATIYALGLTANCLKNRQWRRSQYLVDLLIFEKRFKKFLAAGYRQLIETFGSDLAIRKAWSLKYQVNLFRIQTNY